MQYLEIAISSPVQYHEIIQAILAEAEFEAFVEDGNSLLAYIAEDKFKEDEFIYILGNLPFPGNISWKKKLIENRNWNAEWEKSYEPVIISGKVLVKASFHEIQGEFQHVIQIEPKMAFGTGHHATTENVIRIMLDMNFSGKEIMDFGTGSGILAIMAEKLGASHVLAFDNDEVAVENAMENLQLNNCSNIDLFKGSLEEMAESTYDIMIANITRNTIMEFLPRIKNFLKAEGQLICSGFYESDLEVITRKATANKLQFMKCLSKENWAAALFQKIN